MNAYELADRLIKPDCYREYIIDSVMMLRQQADRIAELEKDLALKTRDRDVFRDFTLAYEKRIEELEKELQESAMNCISAYAQADDHYARLQELEAKVRGEK